MALTFNSDGCTDKENVRSREDMKADVTTRITSFASDVSMAGVR